MLPSRSPVCASAIARRARSPADQAPPALDHELLRVGEGSRGGAPGGSSGPRRGRRRRAGRPGCRRLERADDHAAVLEPHVGEGCERLPRIARQHREQHVVGAPLTGREVAAQHSFAAKAGRLRHTLRADVVHVGGQLEAFELQLVEGPVAHQPDGRAHHAAAARPGRAPVADLAGLTQGQDLERDHRQELIALPVDDRPVGHQVGGPEVLVVGQELDEVVLVIRVGHAVAEALDEAVVAGLDDGRLVGGAQLTQPHEARQPGSVDARCLRGLSQAVLRGALGDTALPTRSRVAG